MRLSQFKRNFIYGTKGMNKTKNADQKLNNAQIAFDASKMNDIFVESEGKEMNQ